MTTLKGMLLKFKPTSKGQKRLFKVGLTGVSTLGIRFLGMSVGLISVPLTAKYLGAERYGLWLLFSSFLGWVGVADLGLTNSLRNALATADGQEDQEKAKVAVSSAFGISVCVVLVVAALFGLTYPHIDWARLFNVNSTSAIEDASAAIVVILILFLFQLILAIPLEIYAAYQEGYLANLWGGASSVLSLAALITAVNHHATLSILIIAVFGAPLLGNFVAAIYLFGWRRPWLRPSFAYFRWNQAIALLRVGSQFWFAQIGALVLLQTDLIVIAQLFGAAAVASYGVPLKLFGYISTIQSAFLGPLWVAYAEALARHDFKWITKIFKHSLTLTLTWNVAASAFLVLFGQQIILLLTTKEIVPGKDLLLAMSVTSIVMGIGQTIAVLMNGLGEVRLQALMGPPLSILNLITSVALGRLIGPAGVSLGTAIAFIPGLLIYRNKLLEKISYLRLAGSNATIN